MFDGLEEVAGTDVGTDAGTDIGTKMVLISGTVESNTWGKLEKTKHVWLVFGIEGKIDSCKITFLDAIVFRVVRSSTLYPLISGG